LQATTARKSCGTAQEDEALERWVLYALISMVFAGFTSVIAKLGLTGISSELGLSIRTCFVFTFVLAFAAMSVRWQELRSLSGRNYAWLGLSGLTTTASWVFYYKAIKQGEVSTVALIDKGSFIVVVILAWVILGERISTRVMLGMGFILTGLLIVSRR
jgi:bacterial/archaeal transporter family protein